MTSDVIRLLFLLRQDVDEKELEREIEQMAFSQMQESIDLEYRDDGYLDPSWNHPCRYWTQYDNSKKNDYYSYDFKIPWGLHKSYRFENGKEYQIQRIDKCTSMFFFFNL